MLTVWGVDVSTMQAKCSAKELDTALFWRDKDDPVYAAKSIFRGCGYVWEPGRQHRTGLVLGQRHAQAAANRTIDAVAKSALADGLGPLGVQGQAPLMLEGWTVDPWGFSRDGVLAHPALLGLAARRRGAVHQQRAQGLLHLGGRLARVADEMRAARANL